MEMKALINFIRLRLLSQDKEIEHDFNYFEDFHAAFSFIVEQLIFITLPAIQKMLKSNKSIAFVFIIICSLV
jgi:hypothetical protein